MQIQTERLFLRDLNLDDSAFILQLLNEPSFLHFIGDRNVRTLEDAGRYIENGPVASYRQNGFGLYLIALKDTGVPIGMCGLIKRPALDDPDIGFALLPAYWSQGYAFEAATAVLAYSRDVLGIGRIVAIAAPDNVSSARLLGRLGLQFERLMRMPGESADVKVFAPPALTNTVKDA